MPGPTVVSGNADWPVVLAFSLLFALAIGVANGEVNHAPFLLPGLHLADPGFLASDWYVTETVHPRRAFTALVAVLARTDRLELGLGIGAIAQALVLAVALYLLARRLYDEPLLPWLLTMLFLATTGTRGIGLSYLTRPQLEASSIAGVAVVCGILALAANWPSVVAGTLFGVAAGLHAHFAVLLLPIVGLVAIAQCRGGRVVDAGWLLLPFILLALPNYAQVLQFSSDPMRQAAQSVSMARFPQHYDPDTWGIRPTLMFLLFVSAGLVGTVLRRPRMSPALTTAVVALFAIVTLSLAVGHTGLSYSVSRLFPWRLSTIVIALSFLFAAAAGSRPVPIPRLLTSVILIAGLVASISWMWFRPFSMRYGFALAIAVVIVGWIQLLDGEGSAVSTHTSAHTRKIAVALTLVGIAPSVVHGVRSSHLKIRADEADRAEVYSWVRENTPGEAIFVTPPGWSDFRLVAQRAIVVDHKAPPVQPTELIEWSDRLQAVTGIPPGAEPDELDAAFFAADCDRIRTIQSRYGARFAIRSVESPRCPQAIYEDSLWVVVEPSADAVESAPDE